MPFLRVVRDRRGYETTYLMHWYREGSRQRSRILYVFRTPGGVRVGRTPLEPETLRSIEAQHPDIAFDWNVVRDNQQIIDAAPEPRRRRAPRAEAEPEAAAAEPAAPPSADRLEPVGPASAEAERAASPEPTRPPIPSVIQGATPAEQTAFLTEWYPIVRERIPLRTADPERRDALFALADRLNPAAWTDADTITTGLQQAAEALERLSSVFARRRRRSRRRPSENRTSDAPDSRPTDA